MGVGAYVMAVVTSRQAPEVRFWSKEEWLGWIGGHRGNVKIAWCGTISRKGSRERDGISQQQKTSS